MTTRPLTGHEQACLDAADSFTAVRGRTPRTRTRQTFSSLAEARAYAARQGDGRTMIYAVTAAGRSAHLENV